MTSEAAPRHSTSNPGDEAKENEFESSFVSAQFPPPRTPLHTIADPAQYHHEPARIGSPRSVRFLDKNFDRSVSANATPRGFNRPAKAHSEPSSAHSTPARTGPRVSIGSYTVAAPRNGQVARGKELASCSSSRVSRGISVPNCDVSEDIPHFELRGDPSFWAEHNVQVLIRIRPLNSAEKGSQGYNRCLRQESANSLVWLGNPETRFTFDHIACETISQEELFRVAGLPMVDNCMSGYNSCIFAYGQTGSGKTHTMMGEINHGEGQLGEHCGMTSRIFEYLFSRIRMEEESKRDEKLKFHCKCSFLEIYNEQITDLLEPSSTNLQLREDLSKGVYVENLSEHNVRTVNDVVNLLLQGIANRKIAATHMNSESSRSHSVFTCIIESSREKDSLTHFRFARLNLVDLAGSERQKSSGADGDRLREAANINKSLSTLGLVIMSLVDLAHGKNRHVPYRDSRLTFLLQDSLGGNSKTMIVANVSPSICSAHETISTLKFAQRAKLIQNNAKVNEDAKGDVGALQRQIQQLKEQLLILMKEQRPPRPIANYEESQLSDCCRMDDSLDEKELINDSNMLNSESKKLRCMKTIMVGALRRERTAETALKQLQAMIEQANQLAHEKEEDVQCTRMMVKMRDEKIRRLELLVDDSVPAEHYLKEENKVLMEEIQVLHARIDKNPEVTRLTLENARLQEQLQLSQKFYEEGEREALLTEISLLRDQIVELFETKPRLLSSKEKQSMKENGNLQELEYCKNMNLRLMREVDELQAEMNELLCYSQAASDTTSSLLKEPEELRHADKYSLVETISFGSESGDEAASVSPENLDHQKKNYGNNSKSSVIQHMESSNSEIEKKGPSIEGGEDKKYTALQANLEKLREDLKEAVSLNFRYQVDQASHLSQQRHVELVSEQVEVETAATILNLQSEVNALQSQLSERLSLLAQENFRLGNALAAKEDEIRAVNEEWEHSTLELTNFLAKGSKSLRDASGQVEMIARSFPQVNHWICDHVERAARVCIEKEETILQLERSLGDTRKMVSELELKLNSLKEATLAFECFPNMLWGRSEDASDLRSALNGRFHKVEMQEDRLTCEEDDIYDGKEIGPWKSSSAGFDGIAALEENTKLNKKYMDLQASSVRRQAFEPSKLGKQLHILNPIRDELRMLNDRLQMVSDFINSKVFPYDGLSENACPVELDGWSPNVYMSASSRVSDCSSGSISSRNQFEGWSSVKSEFSENINNQMAELKSWKGIVVGTDPENSIACCLRNVLDGAFDTLGKIYAQLATFLDENETTNKSLAEENNKAVPCFMLTMEPDDGCCQNIRKVGNDNKADHFSSFVTKCEEARATMKDADDMLNILLKANEDEKQMNDALKQASGDLILDRSQVMEENEQLKISVAVKEKDNESLLDEASRGLTEVENSIASLEGCFQELRTHLQEECEALHRHSLSMGQDILFSIRRLRSSMKSTCSEITGKEFSLCNFDQRILQDAVDRIQLLEQNLAGTSPGSCASSEGHTLITGKNGTEEGDSCTPVTNLSLRKELERKEILLRGLLFDFRLLQETAAKRKDIKDETEKIILTLNEVHQQLEMKTSEVESLLAQNQKVEGHLVDAEEALEIANSDLDQAKEAIDSLSEQNAELRMLVKDLYLSKSEIEQRLDEEKEVVKGLEEEIMNLTNSCVSRSIEDLEEDLSKATLERDNLREEISSLREKLAMAYSLADENEAIAVEARQDLEECKIYSQEKEEEVKILEHSIGELECTINVLEKKVHEMDKEVERHRLIRESSELELQTLRQRLSAVENFADIVDSENKGSALNGEATTRQLKSRLVELHEAHNRISLLERQNAEMTREITQLKEYISEVVLHSEAQASHYQEKYKNLEAMVREFEPNLPSTESGLASSSDKVEKCGTRARGSSSPFRCISGLVQQMNVEKDQELCAARIRIEELEALLASQQKEVCMLKTRLAAAESMTHDVIRDLLGVKLDMTNYANMIDQNQVQILVEEAHQQKEEFLSMEQEILQLRHQINNLMEERDSCMSEMNKKAAELFAAQMTAEQLEQRDQLLSAQYEMLKTDKSNLLRRVSELDDLVKTLLSTQPSQQTTSRSTTRLGADKRLIPSSDDNLMSRLNEQRAQYRRMSMGNTTNNPHVKSYGRALELKHKNQQQ
ncbi:unnamed protein product [Linum trigynum]|uniref:Kinesin motor domain-containing protein n=1 Tax=Linum trigynum TaxID=586398 RepID=A0AAV2FHP9_9ROSI